ncbi:universal stress protein [Fulvivirga maritima]|uniref:universal stress protein n=1 Tax=Fulvivirga maritima TaxID=2904247 RepID=UPI001F41D727|nr:universal stress protein [Fulvivirga maritima]UII25327.1 universal stress protein [Fulvivirga maritima]
MKNLKSILIPIDFTDASKNAVRYASYIFDKESVNLVIVHVTDKTDFSQAEIENKFNTFREETLTGLPHYEFHIYLGNPADELLRAADEHRSSLVIMGLKSENRKDSISIASGLMKDLDCPIIAVPDFYTDYRLKRIAYGNDFKEIRVSQVLKDVMQLALKFSSKLYVFHVNREKEPVLIDNSENILEYYLENIEHEYVAINDKDMENAINNYVVEQKIDLLITLSRDHGRNKSNSEGKLIYQLAENTKIPMLILC